MTDKVCIRTGKGGRLCHQAGESPATKASAKEKAMEILCMVLVGIGLLVLACVGAYVLVMTGAFG